MTLTPEIKERIKEATLAYKHEVEQINRILEDESVDDRREKLYWLRALCSIEQGVRIGLFDDEMDEATMDAMGQEALKYFSAMYDSELLDDIALLDEPMHDAFFDDPAGSKQKLMAELNITF